MVELNAIDAGPPDDSQGEGATFELLASSLRSSSGDLATFVEVLAEKLERGLPGRVRVGRRAGRLFGKKRVETVECDLGEQRYLLEAREGALETRRATAVRGVVLKTEALPLDGWIDALARDLAQEARSSERSRISLEHLLGG